MLAFSAGFAGSGFVMLKVLGWGAEGLVGANAVNMAMRIIWSWWFVRGVLKEEGVAFGVREVMPGKVVVGVGMVVAGYLRVLERSFDGGLIDLVRVLMMGGVYGLMM
jgi:oligosaccharide translocation protein RFT1